MPSSEDAYFELDGLHDRHSCLFTKFVPRQRTKCAFVFLNSSKLKGQLFVKTSLEYWALMKHNA